MILWVFLLSSTLITHVWSTDDIILQDSETQDTGAHGSGAQITGAQDFGTQNTGSSSGSSSTVHRTTTTRRKNSLTSSGGAGSVRPEGLTVSQDEVTPNVQNTGSQSTVASGGSGSTAASTKSNSQNILKGAVSDDPNKDGPAHREDAANDHQQDTGHHAEGTGQNKIGTQKSTMTSGGSTIVSTKTTRQRTAGASGVSNNGAGAITSADTGHHEDDGNGPGIGATGHDEGTSEQHTGLNYHRAKTSSQQISNSGASGHDEDTGDHHKDGTAGQNEAAVQQGGTEQITDNGTSGGSSSTIVSTTTTRRRKTMVASGAGATDHQDATATHRDDGAAIHPAVEAAVDHVDGDAGHHKHRQRSGHHVRNSEHHYLGSSVHDLQDKEIDLREDGAANEKAGQSETGTDLQLIGSSGRQDIGSAIDQKFEESNQKEQKTGHHASRQGHREGGAVMNLETGEKSIREEHHVQIGSRHHERRAGHHGNREKTIQIGDGKEGTSADQSQITTGHQEGGVVIHREFGEMIGKEVHLGHHKNSTLLEREDGDTFRHEKGQGHHAWKTGHHKEGSALHSKGGEERGSSHQEGTVVFDQQFGEALRKEVMLSQHETGSGDHRLGAGNVEGGTGTGQDKVVFHKELRTTFETTAETDGNNASTTYPEHTCRACDEHRRAEGHINSVSSGSTRLGRRSRNRTFRRNARRNRTNRRSSHRLTNTSLSSQSGQPGTLHWTESNRLRHASGSNTFLQRRSDRRTNMIKSTQHVGILHPHPKERHPKHPSLHRPSHHKARKLQLSSSNQIIHLWYDRFFGQYSSEWFQEIMVQSNYCQYAVSILDKSTSSTSESAVLGENNDDTSNRGSGSGSSESQEEGSNEVAGDSIRTADSAQQSGGDGTQAQGSSVSGGVTYQLSMNANGTLSVTKKVKDGNGTETEGSSTDGTTSDGGGMDTTSGTNQTESGSPKQWGFQVDISSSGSIQSADYPPIAAKSFALYLTAFGCWGTQIYAEFLSTYRSTRYPVDETELEIQERNDTWIQQLVDQKANKSMGCPVNTSANGTVKVAEGMSQIRSLDFEESCLLRYGVEELPIPAGVFLAFVKHLGCSAEVLSTYQSFTKVMNDEVAAMRAKGLKFAPSYFLEKAGVILSEQFMYPSVTII